MQKINDYDSITLASIAGGALEEKFQVELEKVLENIDDPNAADGKREINLKISFKPNKKSSAMDIVIKTSCTLQPDIAVETMAFLGKKGARLKAFEHNPDQFKLPMQEGEIHEVPRKTIGGIK